MFAKISIPRKILHIFPILPVYFVILTVTFSITKYFLLDSSPTFISKLLITILFYPFSIMVFITHLKSMFTSPGYVPPSYKNKDDINTQYNNMNISHKHLFCKKCQNDRPPRAHHCKVCKMCVLKMDHHCPWIANCVGFNNQKFFYQFLFYATFGDLVAFFILISRLFYLDSESYSDGNNSNKEKKLESVMQIINHFWKPIMIIFSSLLALSMSCAIGFLFFFQTKMIMNNQTTIENHIFNDATVSPWYYPSKLHNFKIVLGRTVMEWLFPISVNNIYNGGYSFYNPDNLPQGVVSKFELYSHKAYVNLADYNDKDPSSEDSNQRV